MILGIKKLHELVKDISLVENLCEREMNNPEGAGFDLRLGEVYELEGEGFLGAEERDTPKIKLVGKSKTLPLPDKLPPCQRGDKEGREEGVGDPSSAKATEGENDNFFIFEPGKYYLIKTIEKVNLPINLSGIIFPRTTMFRSGLGLFNGIVQPGYSGELTFGICNLGKSNIKVSFGARVVHITFHEVLGEGNQYRGQWQGGRVATEGKEMQV